MDITISDLQEPGGGFSIHDPHLYFDDTSSVAKHTVFVRNPVGAMPKTKSLELSVMFNRRIHRTGTKHSAYIVVRIVETGLAGNLRRADFMAAMMAIEECVGFSHNMVFAHAILLFTGCYSWSLLTMRV